MNDSVTREWRLNRRTENLVGSQLGLVPKGEVRAAIALRFTSCAEPQTRLFWD